MHNVDEPRRLWWQQPPGLVMIVVALALVAIQLTAISLPGTNVILLLMTFIPTAVYAGTWLVRVGAALATRTAPKWDPRFLIVPVIGAVAATAAAFDLPETARWAYAKPRMEAASAAIRDGSVAVRDFDRLRIGGYSLTYDDRNDGNVWFRLNDAGLLNFTFLVHSPEERPIEAQGRRPYGTVEHFDGQWWLVNEIFD